MKKQNKPLANAMTGKETETAVIIIDPESKQAYHTGGFNCDLTKNTTFTHHTLEINPKTGKEEWKETTYKMPAGSITHYHPGILNLKAHIGGYFQRHNVMALFFDWFGLRNKVKPEPGFVYIKGNPEPLKARRPKVDYARENWNIRHNTMMENRLKLIERKLGRQKPEVVKWAIVIGAIIIIIVVAVVAANFMGVGGGPVHTVPAPSNITSAATPTPINLTGVD